MLSERFEMRFPPELVDEVDRWRNAQPVPPSRAGAIRYLIEKGLIAVSAAPSGGAGSGSTKKLPSKAAAPRPRKAGQERKAAAAAPASKEAQLRALREQGAR